MIKYILSNIRTINDHNIDRIILGEVVASLKVLSGHTNNKAYKANSNNTNERIIGVSKVSGVVDEEIKYYTNGATLSNSGWAWDIALPIYTNPTGDLTQTAPTVGVVQQVAEPISSTKLMINIQQPIKLI